MIPGQFIVIWSDGAPPAEREAALDLAGGYVIRSLGSGRMSLVYFPDRAVAESFRGNSLVRTLEPDRRGPSRESDGGVIALGPPICEDCGGGPPPSSQVIPQGVSRIGAYPGRTPYTGDGIGVAIVDSGINVFHRDLIRPNGTRVVKPSPDCYKGPGIFSCDEDVIYGGQGTRAAGVIAAVNNTVDLVGVAPDATLYNINVFTIDPDACYPDLLCKTVSTLVAGLHWIELNHSLVSPPIKVVYVGVRFPIAEGNDALRIQIETLNQLYIPVVTGAGDDPSKEVEDFVPGAHSNVFAIASATTRLGTRDGSAACAGVANVVVDTASFWTTDGAWDPATKTGVRVSAPGELQENGALQGGTCGLVPVGLPLLNNGEEGEPLVTYGIGSSIAAAHVAGVIALMKEQESDLGFSRTIDQVHGVLYSTASRVGEAPLHSRSPLYTFDGEREGIVWAPGAVQ